MLEFIYAIPEELGWALVGSIGTLCAIMSANLCKIFVEMWKEWHIDEE